MARSRRDFDLCMHLCHRISCESWLECLHLLYVVASGAQPCLLAPARLDHLPQTIVNDTGRQFEGLSPHPCFVLDGCFIFFQVSLALSKTARVDVLRWDGRWTVLEIDGKGHDFQNDRRRAFEVAIPVRRLDESELLDLCGSLVRYRKAG